MSTREEAEAFLDEMIMCMPKSFYNDLGATQRGVNFILAYLMRSNGEVIAGDFSRTLNVSTARIAALLKKMERSGLITRHTSSKDARQTIVEITPAGITLANEIREQALAKAGSLLDQIDKEELETFIRISHKIKNVIDK